MTRRAPKPPTFADALRTALDRIGEASALDATLAALASFRAPLHTLATHDPRRIVVYEVEFCARVRAGLERAGITGDRARQISEAACAAWQLAAVEVAARHQLANGAELREALHRELNLGAPA